MRNLWRAVFVLVALGIGLIALSLFQHWTGWYSVPTLLRCVEEGGIRGFVCDKLVPLRLLDKEEVQVLNQFAGAEYPVMILTDREKADRNLTRLLDSGVDINALTNMGPASSALHIAVWLGRPQAVELLLAHHADTSVLDRSGRTPLALLPHVGWKSKRPDDYARILKLLEDAERSRAGVK